MFAAFNPYYPLSYIRVDENGFWTTDDDEIGKRVPAQLRPAEDAGNDVIFGGPGNDWLVGATGSNHLYGGWGDDLLDVNSRVDK
jgi:hypothetical protein